MITKSDLGSCGIISWLWHGLVAQISRAKFSANKAIKKILLTPELGNCSFSSSFIGLDENQGTFD
jgi:hypothetical protein